jgi:pentatricopeptide repeat protein
MMNTVIVSLCRTRPAKEVIKYLEDGVDELPALYLSLSWQAPAMKALSDLFHNDSSLFRLIPGITSSFHPAVFLARKFLLDRRDTSKPIPQPWAKETIEAFLMKPEMIQAREIQGIHGTDGQDHRSFMEQNEGPTKKKDRVVQVNVLAELLDLYPDVDAFSYSTDLFLASARGDVKNAEDCFARYSQRAALTYREVHSLLMAYATIGNLPGLKNAFERLFPHSLEGLTTTYFRPAFYALSLSPIPQPEAMEYWREKMRGAHLVPNSGIYALMLQYYANHDDRDAIATTFREIQRNGIPVNKFVYHNMMTFFARRGEVEPVEKLFKFAKLDGITPDLPFYANLMNAYVEAGRWPGLTATYQLLKAVKAQGGRMIVIQNILMKASHLLGVPFEVLEEHFSSLRDLGETPDAHSYTTLIHAACDAGNTEAAERLYWEMVDRDAVEHGFLNTPHALHLLISAHLHRGDLSKVLFFCQEMEDWGIKPTAATIGRLFIAFAQLPKEKAGLLEPTLKKMVTTLRASNMEKGINGLAVGAALERIYYPAIRRAKACGRSGAELVDQLYRQLVALGHEPSLTMETIILDSFRQRREVELVQSQWENIFHKACQARSQSTHFGVGGETAQANQNHFPSHALCLPFNHYINTLSHNGLFEKIQAAVDLYTQHHFALDPRNYNTLVLAYIRAGDLQRAFYLYDELLRKVVRFSRDRQPQLAYVPPSRNAASRRRRAQLIARETLNGSLTHPRAKDPKVSPLIQLLYNMPQRGYWRISWPVKKALKRLVLALKEGYPVVPLSGRRLSPSPTFYHKSFATTGPDPAAASVQLESLMQFPLAWKAGQIWRKTRYTAERRLERRKRRCDGWRATAVEESLET